MKRLLPLLGLIALFVHYTPAQCGEHCGTERWAVKTLSDSTVSNVNFTPKKKSVHWLVNATPPTGPKPESRRINGLEWVNYLVKAVLIGYKKENEDHDLHVVIADLRTGETMIVEFPDSACSGVCSSEHLSEIQQARLDFLNSAAVQERGAPTTTFKRLNKRVIVEVTGVGFWDFKHGQIGLAKNAIELHPVIFYKELP